MGYLRFGAMAAVFLARLIIGTAWAWDGPEIRLCAFTLLAEMLEDAISYALWRAEIDISPEPKMLTEQEVETIATSRLSKRQASKESSEAKSNRKLASVAPKDWFCL